MKFRIILILLWVSIISACGGGGSDPSNDGGLNGDGDDDIVVADGDIDGDIDDSLDGDPDEQNPEVELQIKKSRNWVAVEGSTLELIPFGRNVSTEEELHELKKGTLFWTITSGSEYASIEQVQRRANVTALIPCPDDNPYCVEVELKLDSSTGEIYTENVKLLVKQSADNLPPVADAGTDQTVSGGDTVSLDGSASLDLDGRVTNYAWSVVSGPLSEEDITGINTATPGFVAPESKYDQVIELKLVVTDDQGLVNDVESTVKITVLKTLENIPPELDSKQNMEGRSGDRLSLTDPLFIDADGTLVNFTWTQNLEDYPDQPVVSDWENADKTGSAVTSITLPIVEEATTLYFTYTVTDNDLDTASTEVEINVIPLPNDNERPLANMIISPQGQADLVLDTDEATQTPATDTDTLEINEGTQICMNGSNSSDPDENGEPLTYEWRLFSWPNDEPPTMPTSAQGCINAPVITSVKSISIELIVAESTADKLTSEATKVTIKIKPVPKIESISFGGNTTATNLPVTTRTVQIGFSDVMNCTSLGSAFSVTDTTADEAVSGSVTCSDRTMSFTADASELAYGHEFEAKLLTSAVNTSGNDLTTEHGENPLTWDFSTAPSATVTMLTDNEEFTDVPVNTSLEFGFSESMDCSTINMTNLIVTRDVPGSDDDEVVYGSFTCPYDDDNKQVRFSPNTYLEHSSKYLVELTHSIKTSGHNPIESGNSFTFTTAEAPQVEIIISGEGDVFVDGDTELEQSGEPIVLPVDYEDALMLTLVPETGYHLEISGCGGTEDPVEGTYTTGQVTDDCQILVKFEIDTFSISYDVDGYGGDIVLESSVAEYNSSVSFNVIPESGYTLDNASLQSNCSLHVGEATNQYILKNIKYDCNIEVRYEIKPTTLYVSAVKNGAILDFNQFENSNLKNSVCYYKVPYSSQITLNNCFNELDNLHIAHNIQTGSYIDGLINGETYRFAYITYDAREGFMSGVIQAPVEVYLPKYYTITGHIRGEEGGTIETSDGVIVDSDGVEVKEGGTYAFSIKASSENGFTISGITGCNGSITENQNTSEITYTVIGSPEIFPENGSACQITASFWKAYEARKGVPGQWFYDIHYAQGRWVAVGAVGMITTSTDQENWMVQQVGINRLTDVHYSNGHWIAVGNQCIYYSSDGQNWTEADIDTEAAPNFNVVFEHNNQWIAAGSGTTNWATSHDGINWELQDEIEGSSRFGMYIRDIAVSDSDRVIGVGSNGDKVVWDYNDNRWEYQEYLGNSELDIFGVAYSNDHWVFVGSNGIDGLIVSATETNDGFTWTTWNAGNKNFNDVKADDSGQFVAVGYSGRISTWHAGDDSWIHHNLNGSYYAVETDNNGHWIAIGSDGYVANWNSESDTWNEIKHNINTSQYAIEVNSENHEWLSVGSNGYMLRTNNYASAQWTSELVGIENNHRAVYSANGKTVVVGNNGQITSIHGLFADSIPNTTSVGEEKMYDVHSNGEKWVAVGSNGYIFTSSDTITWSPLSIGSNTYNSICSNDSLWITVGMSGEIATSSNGIDWINRTSSLIQSSLYGIECAENMFIALGSRYDGKGAYLSPDGFNWNGYSIPYKFNMEIISNVVSNNHYWGAELRGSFCKTEDFSEWDCNEQTGLASSYSIDTDANGNWLITGFRKVAFSTNGIEWETQELSTNTLESVKNISNQWVVVGRDGYILSSLDGKNWITHKKVLNDYKSISYDKFNNQWIAVGTNGQIFSAYQPQD